jgi:hypothetical protein
MRIQFITKIYKPIHMVRAWQRGEHALLSYTITLEKAIRAAPPSGVDAIIVMSG